MRFFCLMALIVIGVMLVLVDLASAIEEAPARGADLVEHMNAKELLRTAFLDGKEDEERWISIESFAAKLKSILKSIKTKIKAIYASLLKPSTSKNEGMGQDADAIARKQQDKLARIVDNHKFARGNRPIDIEEGVKHDADATARMEQYDVKRIVGHYNKVSPSQHPGDVGVRHARLVDRLHAPRYKHFLDIVRANVVWDEIVTKFETFLKTEGGESKAAQTIYTKKRELLDKWSQQKTLSQLDQSNLRDKENLEGVEYTKWIMQKYDREDVQRIVEEGGDEGAKDIAVEIAADYHHYVLNTVRNARFFLRKAS